MLQNCRCTCCPPVAPVASGGALPAARAFQLFLQVRCMLTRCSVHCHVHQHTGGEYCRCACGGPALSMASVVTLPAAKTFQLFLQMQCSLTRRRQIRCPLSCPPTHMQGCCRCACRAPAVPMAAAGALPAANAFQLFLQCNTHCKMSTIHTCGHTGRRCVSVQASPCLAPVEPGASLPYTAWHVRPTEHKLLANCSCHHTGISIQPRPPNCSVT